MSCRNCPLLSTILPAICPEWHRFNVCQPRLISIDEICHQFSKDSVLILSCPRMSWIAREVWECPPPPSLLNRSSMEQQVPMASLQIAIDNLVVCLNSADTVPRANSQKWIPSRVKVERQFPNQPEQAVVTYNKGFSTKKRNSKPFIRSRLFCYLWVWTMRRDRQELESFHEK